MRKPGVAKRVRAAFQEKPRRALRVAELARELGFPYEQVAAAVGDMFRRGELVRVDFGTYRYTGKQIRKGRPPRLLRQICKALHARGVFTAREILLLCGAERSYVHKTLRRLVREGFIEQIGTKKGPKGFQEKLFRLKHRDRFYQKYVLGVEG